ncbi:MAG: hypothetical protein KatS3mg038_1047 [Candidatus Kapaibacterium sp.]|nr:MAG: hypothetical protein KatS3mg038_1047 [Candidatus Kapabacteria bacterium]
MDDLSYAFAAGSRVRVYGMKTAPLELLIPAASDVSVEQKVLIASVSLTSPANDMLVAGIPPDYDTLMIDIGAATTHTSWTGGALRLNDAASLSLQSCSSFPRRGRGMLFSRI